MTIFFVEAFEHVQETKISEYEKLCLDIDVQVQESEPAQLAHINTLVSKTPEGAVYRWMEIFENYEGLGAHLQNPVVQKHMQNLAGGFLYANTKVIVHCDWTDAQKAPYQGEIPGVELSFAPLTAGFFRAR